MKDLIAGRGLNPFVMGVRIASAMRSLRPPGRNWAGALLERDLQTAEMGKQRGNEARSGLKHTQEHTGDVITDRGPNQFLVRSCSRVV
jgi:hypothetical protein